MAMTYTSLIAPKGTAGSIMNWVSYTKLDVGTVVDEAQSLIYTALRVREMETEIVFRLDVGRARRVLPSRFLDPIGDLIDVTNGMFLKHKSKDDVTRARFYEDVSGVLDANPVSVAAGVTLVTIVATNHGLTQNSIVNMSGLDNPVGDFGPNGSFNVSGIPSVNSFTVAADPRPTIAGVGGGLNGVFTARRLLDGTPAIWSIWDGDIKFDVAAEDPIDYKLMCYRAPEPLSSAVPTNFLTDRYPMLMRKACQAAAADYMKDDTEYQKQVQALNNLIASIAVRDDLKYSGMDFGTDTP